ncbi:MAG TPA: IPT/TIG domain-containing protein, partial [Thermoanaerobaculia bacterium]|nr:IPT/TIG domain-containing protein [Thermoanaerobaculia bacterium]
QFNINPSPFVVNQGDQVTLIITAGDTTHGFFLETYDTAGPPIAAGRSRTVTFTANTAGTFTYFCTFQCGEGHGVMNGVFTVNQAAAPPTITSLAPASGPVGGGTNVVITGTNFQNNATVRFGNANAISASVTSSTSITAVAPAQEAGKVNVTVTNPDGTSATFDGYTYQSTAPTISAISPDAGPIAGGTVVTISGSNFQNGVTVRFGSTPAASVTFVSSSQLTVITPPLSAGPVTVTVTNPNGETVTTSYLYTGPIPPRRRATKRG